MFKAEFNSLNPLTTAHVTVYLEGLEYDQSHDPYEKRMFDYIKHITEIITDESKYMDEGGAAKIYELSEGSCLKIVKNRHMAERSHMMNLGLSPLQEFQIMEKLHGIEKGFCRAPVAEMCIESGETAVIVMERLPAMNVQHVLNGTKELPEGFDYDAFYQELEDYIEEMHARGVAHKDLFPRNVMIDEETGLPYVIDFGRAVTLDRLSKKEAETQMDDDWDRYDELFAQMENLRANLVTRREDTIIRKETYTFNKNIRVHYSERILEEAKELANQNPEKEVITLKFGTRENLVVVKDPNIVRGAFQFDLHGQTFYIGRQKRNFDIAK